MLVLASCTWIQKEIEFRMQQTLAKGSDKKQVSKCSKINLLTSTNTASEKSKCNGCQRFIMKGGFKKNQLGWACRL